MTSKVSQKFGERELEKQINGHQNSGYTIQHVVFCGDKDGEAQFRLVFTLNLGDRRLM